MVSELERHISHSVNESEVHALIDCGSFPGAA